MKSTTAQPVGCTNFKLRQLLRAVARLYDAELAQAGLKSSQFSLLSQVKALGPLGPSALAGHMGMDASTLTRNLRPLIDKGWVLQGPGADARQRVVTITPEGVAKHTEAKACWKRAQLQLNRRLGVGDVAALHRLMDTALQRLHEADVPA
ncbi:MAG: winged helix-turn-helix transcriptional regulator [Rhizobacter sp.]|nr:winged helix-turn-helix transcriptional regulator [Rhizobacter sp.]